MGEDHTGGRRPLCPRMDWSGDGVCSSCPPPGILALNRSLGGSSLGQGEWRDPPALSRGRAGTARNTTPHTLLPARPACASADELGVVRAGEWRDPTTLHPASGPTFYLGCHLALGGMGQTACSCQQGDPSWLSVVQTSSGLEIRVVPLWVTVGHCERVVGTSDWLY